MQKKIFLISEALDAPFDEGIKNIVFSLYKQLEKRDRVLLVTREGNNTGEIKAATVRMNKLLLCADLNSLLQDYAPDVAVYIPFASCSFYGLLRAKMLKVMQNKMKVALLCVQHREYSCAQRMIIARLIKPDLLFLLGKTDEPLFHKMGIKVKALPPAIDTVRFCRPLEDEKRKIRAEFEIPYDKKVFLHVGHIRRSRNLECFFDVQKSDNAQVVIVASSTWGSDIELKNKLEGAGIRVIDSFIPDMSDMYKMSDVYIFPVISKTGATEMPLSVLEAMACNLPVITTRHGGLTEFFSEDSCFRYFNSTQDLLEILKDIGNLEESNNKKVETFTWERFADEVVSACREL